MAICGDIGVLGPNDAEPKQTLRDVVSAECLIFMSAEGVDLSAELAKLEKKCSSAEKMVQSYEKKMQVPNYEEKVPRQCGLRTLRSWRSSSARLQVSRLR